MPASEQEEEECVRENGASFLLIPFNPASSLTWKREREKTEG